MAKRATKKAAPKKSAAKRELIAPRGAKRYIRRDPAGRIKESDDVSRSLSQDRRRKAKTAAKPGQGDRGDRKSASCNSSRSCPSGSSSFMASPESGGSCHSDGGTISTEAD